MDQDIAPVALIHRGKYKSLSQEQRRWLKRRQAIEPLIGHTKQDHGMQRCWLKGSEGDALHAVLCAAGFNIRWLMRALLRQFKASGLKHVFLALMALCAALLAGLAPTLRAQAAPQRRPQTGFCDPIAAPPLLQRARHSCLNRRFGILQVRLREV